MFLYTCLLNNSAIGCVGEMLILYVEFDRGHGSEVSYSVYEFWGPVEFRRFHARGGVVGGPALGREPNITFGHFCV